jgi:predicted nucleotidyltransferase
MIRKDIKGTIKEYFFINPNAKLRVREIERVLKLPLPSVIKYCNQLKDEKILSIMSIGKINFYVADKRSESYLLEKKMFNLKQLHSSGLIEHLKENLINPPIILFGSYFKGEDLENSDIDLYVQTSLKKKLDLNKFEKILKRKIQLFVYKNITEVKNLHLANNIINGITLNNYVEVFK